jgi:hypothetical protein
MHKHNIIYINTKKNPAINATYFTFLRETTEAANWEILPIAAGVQAQPFSVIGLPQLMQIG